MDGSGSGVGGIGFFGNILYIIIEDINIMKIII